MTAVCGAPIRGRVYRVVQLDECGSPQDSQVVSKFASIDSSPEYVDGVETLKYNADGSLCVNDKAQNQLKRVGLSIKLCSIDPDGVVIVTGERLLGAGSPVTGSGVAFGEGLLTARFSLEVWQDVAGSGSCDAAGDQRFYYWAYPNVGNPKIGSYTIDQGSPTLELMADTKGAAADWVDGVGADVWLPAGETVETDEHFLFNITTGQPPTAACGATAVS